MRRYPIWNIRHPDPFESLVDVLLANRGLTSDDLTDSPDILKDPDTMADMDRLRDRILQAVDKGERIVVFGDYDVDGVTSTALLLDFLERVGASANALLPDRALDGYGMKPGGVEKAVGLGAELILTVDNGISAFEAVEFANASGLDVVIIDHHSPQDRMPDAHAIINPNRPDCGYPFKGLAAVGVAFKVAQALSRHLMSGDERRSYLNGLLDLVALGTVADLAPMVDENRILTKHGMKVLGRTERPGLRALMEVAGVADRPVDTTTIGFGLGPRLNSAGRLATAHLGLDLLRCQEEVTAVKLAAELNALNSRRQELQKTGTAEAESQVEREGLGGHRMVVAYGTGWHLGVVGLISGKLAEKYGTPAVACTGVRGDGTFTGSARTAGGYNIVEAIFRCSDLLTDYGGHAEAAGFSGPLENFDAFRRQLQEDATARLTEADLTPSLELDASLPHTAVTLETVKEISGLAPFGSTNEAPRFMVPDCRIDRAFAVGSGQHLKLSLRAGSQSCDAIWWRQGELVYELGAGARVDLACTIEENTWNGETKVQLVLEDMRPAEG